MTDARESKRRRTDPARQGHWAQRAHGAGTPPPAEEETRGTCTPEGPLATAVGTGAIAARHETPADHARTIIHLDLDCFYAQVEMVRDPSLRGRPVGIQQKHIIVTCNYHARARGCRKLMLLTAARDACPDLVVLSGSQLDHYRAASAQIFKHLKATVPGVPVQRLGMDEFFLDMTGRLALASDLPRAPGHAAGTVPGWLWTAGGEVCDGALASMSPCAVHGCHCHDRLCRGAVIAAALRHSLVETLGYTCCAGVGHNKCVAKMAGERHKPNQQTTVLPTALDRLLTGVRLRGIPGVGRRSVKQLRSLDVDTVEDVRGLSLERLQAILGASVGAQIFHLVRGIDTTPVVHSKPCQTISIEDSFVTGCCTSVQNVASRLEPLLTHLLQRVDQEFLENCRLPRTFRLTARQPPRVGTVLTSRSSRQCALARKQILPQEDDSRLGELMQLAMAMFHRLVGERFSVSLLNVAVANFGKVQRGIDAFLPAATAASATQACEEDGDGSSVGFGSDSDEEPALSDLSDTEAGGEGGDGLHDMEAGPYFICEQCRQPVASWAGPAHARFHQEGDV